MSESFSKFNVVFETVKKGWVIETKFDAVVFKFAGLQDMLDAVVEVNGIGFKTKFDREKFEMTVSEK